jgi:hypothetical protein
MQNLKSLANIRIELKNTASKGAQMTPKQTAGRRLLAAMNSELQDASEDAGHELEWSAVDSAALDVAAAAADRVAELRQVYEKELGGQARPATLAKLSAELRGLEKQQLDALGKISLDPERLSKVRRKAAQSRWGINGVRGA